MQQHPIGSGLGLEHHGPGVGYQDPRPGPPLAGLHILGENQHLFA